MEKKNHTKALERERKKLNRLVGEALQNGTLESEADMKRNERAESKRGPVTGSLQDERIQKQSRLVDALVVLVAKEQK